MEKWFKFFSADFLLDGKIRNLTSEERSCWISLLCLADTSDIPGEIKHLEVYDLLIMSGLSEQDDCWDRTKKVLEKFVELAMIRNDNGMITILNFRKRQGEALTAYERVKKYRMKRNDNTDDNEMKRLITNDNTNDNTRREENRKEYNNSAKADYRANPKLPDAEETKQLIERLKK